MSGLRAWDLPTEYVTVIFDSPNTLTYYFCWNQRASALESQERNRSVNRGRQASMNKSVALDSPRRLDHGQRLGGSRPESCPMPAATNGPTSSLMYILAPSPSGSGVLRRKDR